jgi:hypothetical protein
LAVRESWAHPTPLPTPGSGTAPSGPGATSPLLSPRLPCDGAMSPSHTTSIPRLDCALHLSPGWGTCAHALAALHLSPGWGTQHMHWQHCISVRPRARSPDRSRARVRFGARQLPFRVVPRQRVTVAATAAADAELLGGPRPVAMLPHQRLQAQQPLGESGKPGSVAGEALAAVQYSDRSKLGATRGRSLPPVYGCSCNNRTYT